MSQPEEEKPYDRILGEVKVNTSPITMKLQAPRTMGDLAQAVYEQQSISQNVRDALAKFEYKPITRSELGRYMGLSQSELAQLDMFWDPAFGKGWIYLSDEMIKTQMTTKIGKNAVTQFYDEILDVDETKIVNGEKLRKDYFEGEHFKRLAWDDPLIDLYFKSCSPNPGSNSKRKNVAGKRYYAVSGDTYSDLLTRASTESGKISRSLFRKIIIGTRLFLEYMNALHAIFAQGRIEEEKTRRIDAESRAITLEKEKRGPKEYPQEWFYIVTCDLMALSRAYKFGIITKSNTPEKRISAYDCGYIEHIALDFVFIVKTHNAKAIEDSFRATVRRCDIISRIHIKMSCFCHSPYVNSSQQQSRHALEETSQLFLIWRRIFHRWQPSRSQSISQAAASRSSKIVMMLPRSPPNHARNATRSISIRKHYPHTH